MLNHVKALLIGALCVFATSYDRPLYAEELQFSFGGYFKLDTILSTYSDGDHATSAIGEDFLVPSTIPVGGDKGKSYIHLHAKSSRVFIKSSKNLNKGSINTLFEVDAIGSSQGNERVSNSYATRLRHAYVNWNNGEGFSLLAGQSWSTFFNVASLAESLDFVGAVGTIFERQAQLRFTKSLGSGQLHFAVENPSTRLYGSDSLYDDNTIPDLVLRYASQISSLQYSLALMYRELAYQEDEADDSTNGYGASFSGVWKIGQDNIKFMANYGNALGRYLGLHSFNTGVIKSDGEIELIDQWGAVLSFHHLWNSAWRSNIILSASHADHPESIADGTPSDYQSIHFNLLHAPVDKLTIGGEYLLATKQVANKNESLEDDKGNLSRLQFTVKYVL